MPTVLVLHILILGGQKESHTHQARGQPSSSTFRQQEQTGRPSQIISFQSSPKLYILKLQPWRKGTTPSSTKEDAEILAWTNGLEKTPEIPQLEPKKANPEYSQWQAFVPDDQLSDPRFNLDGVEREENDFETDEGRDGGDVGEGGGENVVGVEGGDEGRQRAAVLWRLV
ncbi:hypothetical protein U1Q18_025241 [Sarracenia purpurea var. burkii]